MCRRRQGGLSAHCSLSQQSSLRGAWTRHAEYLTRRELAPSSWWFFALAGLIYRLKTTRMHLFVSGRALSCLSLILGPLEPSGKTSARPPYTYWTESVFLHTTACTRAWSFLPGLARWRLWSSLLSGRLSILETVSPGCWRSCCRGTTRKRSQLSALECTLLRLLLPLLVVGRLDRGWELIWLRLFIATLVLATQRAVAWLLIFCTVPSSVYASY